MEMDIDISDIHFSIFLPLPSLVKHPKTVLTVLTVAAPSILKCKIFEGSKIVPKCKAF